MITGLIGTVTACLLSVFSWVRTRCSD